MSKLVLTLAVLALAAPALAQAPQAQPTPPPGQQPAAPAFDPMKMGPGTRKIANEKDVKKAVETFLKQADEIAMKHDVEASANQIDFPVFMVTDSSAGVVMATTMDRQMWMDTMRPFFAQPMPKDMKWSNKYNITLLTDALASVVTDVTMSAGKKKQTFKSVSLVVKTEGGWKYKMMTEGGWGDVMQQQAPASAPAPEKK